MMADTRRLDDLAANPANAKRHDLVTIAESIRRFGFADPVLVDSRTGRILSGHGRADALAGMRDAGETPPDGITVDDDGEWLVPVYDGWASRSDREAEAATVALNRTVELGGWDEDALVGLLDRLSEVEDGLVGVGYGAADIDRLREQLADLDDGYDPAADDGRGAADATTFAVLVPPSSHEALRDALLDHAERLGVDGPIGDRMGAAVLDLAGVR